MSCFFYVQQSLITDRKTLRLARLLGIDRYAVVGRLVALWAWCLENAPDGRLTDDVDAEMLAEVMGWDASLGTPDKLLEEMLAVGFLDVDPQDGTISIHSWADGWVDGEVAP